MPAQLGTASFWQDPAFTAYRAETGAGAVLSKCYDAHLAGRRPANTFLIAYIFTCRTAQSVLNGSITELVTAPEVRFAMIWTTKLSGLAVAAALLRQPGQLTQNPFPLPTR